MDELDIADELYASLPPHIRRSIDDQNRQHRMDDLNAQLKLMHTGAKVMHPGWVLCGECLLFHSKTITCDEVQQMVDADMRLMRYAVG